MLNLLEKQPIYKIGRIVKVKNLSTRGKSGFSWLLIVEDQSGGLVARIGLNATGLYCCTLSYPENRKPIEFKTEDFVRKTLSTKMRKEITSKEIKKIEYFKLVPSLGTKLIPARRITLSNGTEYYYSVKNDAIFKIKKRVPWKKNERGSRRYSWNNEYKTMAYSEIDDEIIVFEEIK